MAILDPVELTAALVRCQTITPKEGGALELLVDVLTAAGFDCTRVDRNGTPNLFARWGPRGHPRSLGFNGHTDVVPVGNADAWTVDPFGGVIRDGRIWGRGACDMKSGVAAFVVAAVDFVQTTPPDGAVLITITGDEEGASTDGTLAIVDWMRAQSETMSSCLVGEPTCPNYMGEMIKIGRRGAMTVAVIACGVQGHSAYPDRTRNPLHALNEFFHALISEPMDRGNLHFDPSTVAITNITTLNPARNVIPAQAEATVNIRFNDIHSGASVSSHLRALTAEVMARTGVKLTITVQISGEAFLTPPGPFSDIVAGAVLAETGVMPVLSTSGGTSDARFLKDLCPVVEVGLVGSSMHQVDEFVETEQIYALTRIYRRILADWFCDQI